MHRAVPNMRIFILILIRAYQLTLSRIFAPVCRFEPSCSVYTAECVKRFGAVHGLYLGCRRILRCHPWHPGGVDPVPERGMRDEEKGEG